MSIETIIKSLEELVNVHEDLLAISKQKTEIVKEGTIEKLQALLVKERKLIRKLEQGENWRKSTVDEWFANQQLPPENATITYMLELLTNEKEQKELENVTIALTKTITELKSQEQLNQALINQSVKFVQFSMDMMRPSLKNMNYGNNKENQSLDHSVFDSKA